MKFNITHEYITEEISYFTSDNLNQVANKFTFNYIFTRGVHYVEFEVFLINEIKELPIIHRTILQQYQFTYLGEELFKAFKREGLDNTENKSDKLVFRFKFR